MIQDHGEPPHIRFVTQNLFSREEVWAVWTARPRMGFGEPRCRALFAVANGEDPGPITRCALGRTPLAAKHPIDRAMTAALHPALVRRVGAAWATLDDAGSPDNAAGDTDGDGAGVLAELDRLDPALDMAEVDALLVLNDEADADGPGRPAGVGAFRG